MCICKSCCHIRASVFVCVFVLLCHAKVSADAVCFDSLRPLLRFALSLSLCFVVSLSPPFCVVCWVKYDFGEWQCVSHQRKNCIWHAFIVSRSSHGNNFFEITKVPNVHFLFSCSLFSHSTFIHLIQYYLHLYIQFYSSMCACATVAACGLFVCARVFYPIQFANKQKICGLRMTMLFVAKNQKQNRILYSTYTHILYILYIFIHLFLFSPLCHSFCSCFCFFHFLYFFVFRMGVENAFGKADCTGFWSCGKLRKQFYQFYGYVSTANAIMHRTHSCPLGSLRAWCWLFVCGPM